MAKAVVRREPGQSLKDQIAKLDEAMEPRIGVIGACFVMLVYESIGYFMEVPRQPWFPILLLFVSLLWFYRHARADIALRRKLNTGLLGEQKTASYLDKLKASGVEVFHDIQCGDFNIDHVLVSTRGIQVVETKYWRPKEKGGYVYDGKEIVSDNGTFRTDRPLRQAEMNAKWLCDRLEQLTGRKFAISAVVLFPERFVKVTIKAPEIVVQNADYFVKAFADTYSDGAIPKEDLALIIDRLKMLAQG